MSEPSTKTDALTIDPRLLNQLKGIELRSRYLVRGLYDNRHRTMRFGASTEFIELREYRWGDEIRSIDWRTYARTRRFFVKRHEMESIMKVNLLLDTSDSMRVPPLAGLMSKLDLACVISGAIAMMAIGQQDSAGLLCLGNRIGEQIPCKQGQSHLALMYQHLAEPKGSDGGNFGELVQEAAGHLGSRGVVFIVTDALDDSQALLDGLKLLRVREHDVSLIQVLDQRELNFPYDQMTEFRHPETGARIVGNPLEIRKGYLEKLDTFLTEIQSFCKSAQVDYLRLHNGGDLVKLLSLHFLKRLMVKAL